MKNTLALILFFLSTLFCYSNIDESLVFRDSKISDFNIYPLLNQQQLPSNSVRYTYQDSEGFLWIATDNGICFYDGYNTKVFRYDSQGNMLRNNRISYIVEDKKGRIWFSSVTGGFVIDKRNGFNLFSPHNQMSGCHVSWIEILDNGEILVSLTSTVLRFDEDLNLISSHKLKINKYDFISCMIEARDGSIYLLLNRAGVIKYDINSNKISRYNQITSNCYLKFIQDPDKDYFWITTSENGIIRFDPKASDSNQIFTIQKASINNSNSDNSYSFINIDPIHGDLWSVSKSNLCRFERLDNGELKKVHLNNFALNGKLWEDISIMNNGNLIISSCNDNSYVIDFREVYNKFYTPIQIYEKTGIAPAIRCIAKVDDNRFLFFQERFGPILYNSETDKVYTSIITKNNIRKNDFVNIIQLYPYKKDSSIIWGVHHTKAIIYKIRIIDDNIIVEDEIVFGDRIRRCYLAEDKYGNLFVNNGRSIFYYNIDTNEQTLIKDGLKNCRNMLIDSSDALWINDPKNGIFKLINPYENDIITEFFNREDYVITDFEVIDSFIYYCTEDGRIFKMNDGISEELTSNIVRDGNKLYNIIKDNNSSLWIFSDQKVIEYSVKDNFAREYSTFDYNVPLTRFIPGAIGFNKNNEIYYGGYGGFGIFGSKNNNSLISSSDNIENHTIVISDIISNGESLMFSGDSKVCNSQNLNLTEKQSDIIVCISNLDILNCKQMCYAYKMKDDENWKIIDKGDNKIFLHLSKGNHTLQIRSRGSDGKWSDVLLEYNIFRAPYIYETTHAYILYFLLIILFITALSITYKRILERRNTKKLENDLVKIKLDYFSNISHDLLTPLTIISCAAEDIDSDYESDKENVNIIRSNIIRLKQLFQEILDFRKFENGKMTLNIKYGQLDALLFNIIECFKGVINRNNISLNLDIKNNITGYFDPDKIEKIIFNILSNAIKYTNQGDSISISLYADESENKRFAYIEIRDTGIGIAESEHDKIFSPFYNNPDANPGISNGIGLSLCRQIATLHKGEISLKSKQGKGSLFIIKFPIDSQSYNIINKDEIVEMTLPESQSGLSATPNRRSILIVEDDIELQSMIKKLFTVNYMVFVANSGVEALSIVASKNIDMVVSDISMPGMDGITLCKRIKSDVNTSHIPVLLLTAGITSHTRVESYKAGADSFLEKPFDKTLLKTRVENLINKFDNASEKAKKENKLIVDDFEVSSIDEEFLNKVIFIINDHISDSSFDLNTLSSGLCMSRSTFSRKLKAITGQTPIDFINNIKMKRACKMLKETNHTITEIAYKLGIEDSRYFARRFKESFKMTPSKFRELD